MIDTMFAKNNVLETSYLDNLENKLLSVVLTKKVLALRNRDYKRSVEIAI
jgi:hypothetical protein